MTEKYEDRKESFESNKKDLLDEGVSGFKDIDEFKQKLLAKLNISSDEDREDFETYWDEIKDEIKEEFEKEEQLQKDTEELKELGTTLQNSESFKYFGAEINTFLASQKNNPNNPNETPDEALKRRTETITKLKEDLQKINLASRVTEMGVTQEFAESFGGLIWEDFNNSIRTGLSSGNLDMGKILEEKKKIAEEIKEEFELAKESEKLLEDERQINRSATHLIESGLTPNDLDNDKLIRLLQKRTGKEFKHEATKSFLSQQLLDFKLNVSDKYEETIVENTAEAEGKFQSILKNVPKSGFQSQEEFQDYIQNQVQREMGDFFTNPPSKLPNDKWDSLRDNFMIPSASEHWDKYLENGGKNVNAKLDKALIEAQSQDFQTKEELIKFLQTTTNELNREKLVPDDFWNNEIADPFHAKVNILWEQKEEINEGNLEAVKGAMNGFKLSFSLLREAQPRTEADFIRLGKEQLKEKFGHVFGKISDDKWDMMMKAHFYPRIKRRIKSNEKAIVKEMNSLSFLGKEDVSKCSNEKEYIEAFKAKFRKEKYHVFGWVPNENYNRIRDQHLLKRARKGWLEHERSENEKINKARTALNPQNIVGTVHHFAKSKGIKNPSVSDFQKSSTKALISQFGLTKNQAEKLRGDLISYAQQAKQEHSRRKSRAISEVNRYGNDVSKVENFTEADLNQPINLQNPKASGFYRKMVAQVGDMKFENVDDWYLVANEALGKMDGIRQQKLKEASRDKVLDKDESMESTVSKIQGLMKNISISDEKLQGKEMKTEADFFALGKKELRKEHGQLSDKEWDKQMEKVFYPQMKAQLKAKENVVSQSMRNATIALKAEDLEKVETEEEFVNLAKKSFSTLHGQKIFGLIPDENYDKLKGKYLDTRIQKLWKNFEKKKEKGEDVEDLEDENTPELAKKWGLDTSKESKEITESKGFSRLTELTSQNQYGLSGLDSKHMKEFGPLLVNLMEGIDKDKFDKVKTALRDASLTSITDKKEQFLQLTQILVSVGFENNQTDVKNIIGKTSGVDTRFNNFFGNTLLDLRGKDLDEKSEEEGLLAEIPTTSLDEGELINDEDLEEDGENGETVPSTSFMDEESMKNDFEENQTPQKSGQSSQQSGIQDTEDIENISSNLQDKEDLEDLNSDNQEIPEEEIKKIPEQDLKDISQKIPENEDLSLNQEPIVEKDIEENSDLQTKLPDAPLDVENISMQEISLEESENKAQNIDEDITGDEDEEKIQENEEDSVNLDSEEIPEEEGEANTETQEDSENLNPDSLEEEADDTETSENLEDESDSDKIEDVEDTEDTEEIQENLEDVKNINSEDIDNIPSSLPDKGDLEGLNQEEDVENKDDLSFEDSKENLQEEKEDLEEDIEGDEEKSKLEETAQFEKAPEVELPKIEKEKTKEVVEKEEIQEEQELENVIIHSRTEQPSVENLDGENQGNQSGKKQWGSRLDEEVTIQKVAEKKLKNKELAKKLITGKSLVLLSDEELATIFNKSHEWDLTGDSELTLLQIIKMAHVTLEVSKGGKKLGLKIKLSRNQLAQKLPKFEVLLDGFISTAIKIQNLKSITVLSVKDGRLMGIWGTGFGDIPFKILM